MKSLHLRSLVSYYMIYKIANSDLFRQRLLFSKNITAYKVNSGNMLLIKLICHSDHTHDNSTPSN
jgi:hypothetical protein